MWAADARASVTAAGTKMGITIRAMLTTAAGTLGRDYLDRARIGNIACSNAYRDWRSREYIIDVRRRDCRRPGRTPEGTMPPQGSCATVKVFSGCSPWSWWPVQ
jgi:hypothetical protein